MNIVRSFKILLIDDDVEVLASLAKLIEMEIMGSKVNTVNCPIKALDTLKINHYDLIISDEKMSNLSGTELLSLADKALKSYTPFIIYTGSSELVNPIKISSRHFYAIIEKPRHNELIKAIKRIKLESLTEVKNI